MANYRIRVAGLVCRGDQILLVQQANRSGHKRWSLPGGGLEPTDADIYAGAVREVFEETGLRVKAENLRFITEYFGAESRLFAISLIIQCVVEDGEDPDGIHLGHTQPDDNIHDVRWWSRASLLEASEYTGYTLTREEFWKHVWCDDGMVRHLGRQRE